MTQPKTYCTAPWNGITIREDGKVRTCCAGSKVLLDLNTGSIDDLEQSPVLKEIQRTMLSGQPDEKNCSNCIQQEKISGYDSLRNHYNTYFPDFDLQQVRLKMVDLRWNNLCNLSCMYCQPSFSSVWADKLGMTKITPVKTYQDQLLSWILTKSHDLKHIMLVGGEPLLMKQNYQLLKHLPDDCQIDIITNMSYDLQSLPCLDDLLRRPADRIIWNVSVENVGAQFEYVRQGAKWTQFCKNIEFLLDHWPHTVSLNMVYSMFSAFDLLDTFKIFHGMGVKKFSFLPLALNRAMNVYLMPATIKSHALLCFEQAVQYHNHSIDVADLDKFRLHGTDPMIAKLKSTADSQHCVSRTEFHKQITWYDQWSTTKFKDLWPGVIDLVDQHLAD